MLYSSRQFELVELDGPLSNPILLAASQFSSSNNGAGLSKWFWRVDASFLAWLFRNLAVAVRTNHRPKEPATPREEAACRFVHLREECWPVLSRPEAVGVEAILAAGGHVVPDLASPHLVATPASLAAIPDAYFSPIARQWFGLAPYWVETWWETNPNTGRKEERSRTHNLPWHDYARDEKKWLASSVAQNTPSASRQEAGPSPERSGGGQVREEGGAGPRSRRKKGKPRRAESHGQAGMFAGEEDASARRG